MNASGNTTTLAPVAAASATRRRALSTHAAASNGMLPACTTATCTVCAWLVIVSSAWSADHGNRIRLQRGHQLLDMLVPRGLDDAHHAHRRKVRARERAVVHDFLDACTGRRDHLRKARETARAIHDRYG